MPHKPLVLVVSAALSATTFLPQRAKTKLRSIRSAYPQIASSAGHFISTTLFSHQSITSYQRRKMFDDCSLLAIIQTWHPENITLPDCLRPLCADLSASFGCWMETWQPLLSDKCLPDVFLLKLLLAHRGWMGQTEPKSIQATVCKATRSLPPTGFLLRKMSNYTDHPSAIITVVLSFKWEGAPCCVENMTNNVNIGKHVGGGIESKKA